MSRQIFIQAKQLTKQYGDITALDRFSLEVEQGEIMALVGPNGAGKTTALKLLVGLIAPTAGQTWIGSFDVIKQSLEAKKILAYIPDQPFLYEQLTVAETIGFIAGMYRMSSSNLSKRVEKLMPSFGLTPLLNRRVAHLSYGMKSRLALLVSLLHDPKVLIMDEPFFGLDPQTFRMLKELITQLAQEGLTVLLSSHQLSAVEDLAHRVSVLNQGKNVTVDSLEGLKKRYGGSRLEDVFFNIIGSNA